MARPASRRRQPRALTRYTDGHRDVLRQGYTLFWQTAPGFYRHGSGFHTGLAAVHVDAVREAWQALRDELLPQYIREHPGQRPFAWWAFDAPENGRRKMLRGPARLAIDGPTASPVMRTRWSFGTPSVFSGGDYRQPILFESQPAFLDRHGLLTDEEREALGDFETEEVVCRPYATTNQ